MVVVLKKRHFVHLTSGQRFGKWTVKHLDTSTRKTTARGARWICECDCGTIASVTGNNLTSGHSTKCKKCNPMKERSWFVKIDGVEYSMADLRSRAYKKDA